MCLTHEKERTDAEMEQLYLMPGEERYTKFQDENGVPKVRYTYCSLHGRLFNCTCKSMDEAQRLCEVARDTGSLLHKLKRPPRT